MVGFVMVVLFLKSGDLNLREEAREDSEILDNGGTLLNQHPRRQRGYTESWFEALTLNKPH